MFLERPEQQPSEAQSMTPQLHAELRALCSRYFTGQISEEEWALLQIHMAYCDACYQTFRGYQQDSHLDGTR